MAYIILIVVGYLVWNYYGKPSFKNPLPHSDEGQDKNSVDILHFVLHGLLAKMTAEERIEFRDQMGSVKRQMAEIKSATIDIENLVFASKNETVTKVFAELHAQSATAPTQYSRIVKKDLFIKFLANNI